MAFTASIDELYGLGYDFYQKFSEKVDSVTVQDVRRLAHTYLDISKAVIVITKPKGVDGKNDE
jgi:predicted Zn-dependent peptidase